MSFNLTEFLGGWMPVIVVILGIVGFFIALKLLKKAVTCAVAILIISLIAAGVFLFVW